MNSRSTIGFNGWFKIPIRILGCKMIEYLLPTALMNWLPVFLGLECLR